MHALKVFLYNFAFPVEMAATLTAYFLTSTLLSRSNKVSPRNIQAISLMPAMTVLVLLTLILRNPCFVEHTPTEGSCTEPVVCSVCGTELESAPGHDWAEATEETPKTCLRCGLTEGEPLPQKEVEEIKEPEKSMKEGPSPSEADMEIGDERIEAPEVWADEYKTVFVDGKGDERTDFYVAPDKSSARVGSLPDAVMLTVLAEEKGFCLCKQYDECIGWCESRWLTEKYTDSN